MKKLALLAFCALAGCAQVQTFTAADATSAVALAQAAGDTQAVPCYQQIGTLAGAQLAPGLLTKFELFRAGQALAEGQCSSVFAGLALHLLNKVPGTP